MTRIPLAHALFPAVLALALSAAAAAQAPASSPSPHWVGTWATSQQIPEPYNSLPPEALTDATVRQIFHVSIAGDTVRVRLSNVFGTRPLRFTSVHIARAVSAASSDIVPGTDTALTFSGAPDVTVPAGAQYLSDPVHFPIAALSNVAVSFHLDAPPARETGHPGSRETTYYLHGDRVSDASLPAAQKVDHWYEVSGLEVEAPPRAAAIVALGDSITDGHATTTNGNDRWTDDLAERLQADPATRDIAVLNEGIGGNRLLLDGLGPNALARVNRDVIAQAGVRWVIVLEGINDLGTLTIHGPVPAAQHQQLVHDIIAAYQQIVERAHAHGLFVIGGTLTPDGGNGYYHPGPASEADREAINRWIRTPGHFDAVVDFDKLLRDPSDPHRLAPRFDSGDHLHPSLAGYRAMAQAIPLALFAR